MRRHSRPAAVVSMLCLLLAGGLQACTKPQDQGAVRAAIEARNQEIGAAVAKGDSAALAALYTANAILMPPHAPSVSGREAIQGAWKSFIDSGIKGLELKSTETAAHGDTADEAGVYQVLGPEGAVLDTGKYIVIWKLENGSWFLLRDIWNSNNPPPPPPAPAPAPAPAAESPAAEGAPAAPPTVP